MRHEFVVESPEATFSLGRSLGNVLEPGNFVGLMGTLGAGKTLFVRGVAAGAEVPPSEVASPTFAIVYTYEGRLKIHHADLYRLENRDELYATGFDDWVADEAATLVEWVDKVPQAAPPDVLEIQFKIVSEKARSIAVKAQGEKSQALLRRWLHGR